MDASIILPSTSSVEGIIFHNQSAVLLATYTSVPIELIAKPTIRGNATLKTYGEHPEEKKEITAHDGKYGFYVKCGKINASLLGDQAVENINLEDAIKLINDRKIKMGQKVAKKKIPQKIHKSKKKNNK